jgi:hypothetical protein
MGIFRQKYMKMPMDIASNVFIVFSCGLSAVHL